MLEVLLRKDFRFRFRSQHLVVPNLLTEQLKL
jgi:hypothetical protein